MKKASATLIMVAWSTSTIAATHEKFQRIVLDRSPNKPAFIAIEDLNADGKFEVIVSMFGNSPAGSGSVEIYKQGSSLESWTKTRLSGSETRFPNEVSVYDVNGDGRKDIILPGGFLACTFPFGACGSLNWFQQNADGSFKVNNLIKGQSRFYHHVQFVDWDFDGIKDLVAVGEEKGLSGDGSSILQYFKGNKTALGFETKPKDVFKGLGSFPTVLDIDGNGDWEVFSSEYFGSAGSFAWLDQAANGTWQRYYIDSGVGKTIQLQFVDGLYGDGKTYAVGANHTNTMDNSQAPESAVYVYEVPDFQAKDFNPAAAWKKTKVSEGIVSVKSPLVGPQGAPGVFAVGDVDGDQDKDIIVHGDGDPRIFWLEQTAAGVFKTNVLDTEVPQGGVAVEDLDGDGVAEIVGSSYEKNLLFIYKFVN